jgi:hypothetical protein
MTVVQLLKWAMQCNDPILKRHWSNWQMLALTFATRDLARAHFHHLRLIVGKRAWRTTLALRRIIVGFRALPRISNAARSFSAGLLKLYDQKLPDRASRSFQASATATTVLPLHVWLRHKPLEPNLLEDIMIDLCALNDPEHISFS